MFLQLGTDFRDVLGSQSYLSVARTVTWQMKYIDARERIIGTKLGDQPQKGSNNHVT